MPCCHQLSAWRNCEPAVDADPRGGERSDRRGSFGPVGNHRVFVHGRRQTTAVRDGSLDYGRDPGVRTRAQRCYARLYGGLPQYRRNCPRSADHRGCAAAGHGCVTSHSTTLWNPLVARRGRLAAHVAVDWPPSFPLRHRPAPLGWSSRSVMARRVNKVTPHTGRR